MLRCLGLNKHHEGDEAFMKDSFQQYQKIRMEHWDMVASQTDNRFWLGKYYHQRLKQIYRNNIASGQRVLEIGCGTGELLASVQPSFGVGIDLSRNKLKQATGIYTNLHFIQADAQSLSIDSKFDIIILSDLLNDLWDIQALFDQIFELAYPHTRIIINNYSHLWQPLLAIAERLKFSRPNLQQNWLTVEDTANFLHLSNLEVIRHWPEILWPIRTPLLDELCNRYLVKVFPFRIFALSNLIVARPQPSSTPTDEKPTVSVVVAARNEADNIANIFKRVPEIGAGTELVFVEGHSKDNTFEVIQKEIERNPDQPSKLFQQTGIGKGDAVRMGFEQATGDIFMILDADLTVPPENLPLFYEALVSGKGEFINGVRLVYPMEKQAMRFANLIGNKFFSLAFSWLLGQSIKDTLCGTKVLWKSDYEKIAKNRSYFGDFDPFGDYDLLFGAAKLNLKIIDLPIRYRERTYGTTNIQRWKHGWLLLKMTIFAANRLKFI